MYYHFGFKNLSNKIWPICEVIFVYLGFLWVVLFCCKVIPNYTQVSNQRGSETIWDTSDPSSVCHMQGKFPTHHTIALVSGLFIFLNDKIYNKNV